MSIAKNEVLFLCGAELKGKVYVMQVNLQSFIREISKVNGSILRTLKLTR